MAPQHPRKPTTIIRAPAASRMYTPTQPDAQHERHYIHHQKVIVKNYFSAIKKM